MSHVHINWTRYSERRVVVQQCPTEKRRRRMLACFQEWYGWDITCSGCGDHWSDGWRSERPFRRGWREEAIKRVKAQIAALPAKSKAAHPTSGGAK